MIGDMESTLLIDAAYRANFDLPQIPEPDGSYVLNQKLWYVYKEKARESVPVTHPALWGLRIAHPVRTSNADTTPIQRQISCNNQNDKKLRVNANIYSI